MICLFCGSELAPKSRQCEGCSSPHSLRPPVSGINHVSQMLVVLDDLRKGELDVEDAAEALQRFIDMFEHFEQKWRLQESSLTDQLSPALKDTFAASLSGIDQALGDGYQAIALMEGALAEGQDTLDAAEEHLLRFFRGCCANAAKLLEDLDALKISQGKSGSLFNLPSV
ncbi:MAG: hypothetical protein KC910_00550 [Candidatus Eremiobacteraeota bacterium]|nr:hypothetical protein [Candidatus Eremiobacteraeota bacterium]